MSSSALDLHLAALYKTQTNNAGIERIHAVNQWDGGPVPVFHYAWSKEESVCRLRADVTQALAQELQTYFEKEDHSRDCFAGPEFAEAYKDLIGRDFRIQNIWHGVAYWRTEPVVLSSQRTRVLAPEDAEMLQADLEPWRPDLAHRAPFVVAHNTEQAISVCASVRITPQAHEAGVETMHAYRRGGYGDAAVRRWTNEVLALGAIPLYSTSKDNTASQRLARRVGYSEIGYEFYIHAEP